MMTPDNDGHRDEALDAKISGALRKAVAHAFKRDPDTVTLRYIRNLVEEELDLEQGFFKSSPHWKDHSKVIILQEVEIQQANPQSPENPPSVSAKNKRVRKPIAKKAVTSEPKANNGEDEKEDEQVAPKPRKRGRPAKPAAEKKKPVAKRGRGKSQVEIEESDIKEEEASKPKVEDNDDDSFLSDLPDNVFDEPEPLKKKARKSEPKPQKAVSSPKSSPKSSLKVVKASKVEPIESENDEPVPNVGENGAVAVERDSGDESEMSIVIDEPPKRKRRSRSAASPKETKKKGKASRPKKEKAPGKELSPDEEKIKSLQGWLLKCGIRKMWSRELAKFDTLKEKIQHLKNLLTEAGMTGQYSMAKAKKIKDKRELDAEVASVQKGDTDWGKESDEKVTTRSGKVSGSTGRKLVQRSHALESLDFLGNQSDDDSD